MTTILTPTTLEEVRQAVLESAQVRPSGAGTKTALVTDSNMSLRQLSGVLEYTPSEYTFTANAGTPLREIRAMLAENKQFLPFDPPLAGAGATLGGTVAAGLSGSGRYRFGGLRDFFLGVRLVTGEGRIVFGGGRVVKNAAGFDFPKLLVGSLGRLAIMVELTFKVFPAPAAFRTLKIECEDFPAALQSMRRLSMSQVELYCLDLAPPNTLIIRVGGLREALDDRARRVRELAPGTTHELHDEEEAAYWDGSGEFDWIGEQQGLVKLPLTSSDIEPLEKSLSDLDGVSRRYAVGGNLAWLGWPAALDDSRLAEICSQIGRPALVLRGGDQPTIGTDDEHPLLQRLRSVFDPSRKLG